ncbi:hypothetical protein [Maritalea sp.]|uniref:hypothetical protein n=1 Tax=Maritalea sp. TaxID=2003361 RepID=UPI003EFA0E3F
MEDELTSLEHAKNADARLRVDRDDYNDAIAGRDSGRMTRFGGKSRARREIEKKKAEKAFRDALDLLLQDPEYRALYETLGESLATAEIEADTVIANLEAALQDLDAQIADMEARAAKGPDGRPVFKTGDGQTVYADGTVLRPEIAEGIIWPPNAPSGSNYFDAKDRRADGAALLADWQGYRHDTLGGIRDRYDDRENPMSKDAMRDALDSVENMRPAQASVTPNELEVSISAPAPNNFPSFGS